MDEHMNIEAAEKNPFCILCLTVDSCPVRIGLNVDSRVKELSRCSPVIHDEES